MELTLGKFVKFDNAIISLFDSRTVCNEWFTQDRVLGNLSKLNFLINRLTIVLTRAKTVKRFPLGFTKENDLF